MIKLVFFAVLALGAAAMIYVRVAPTLSADWHEDPDLVRRPSTPNYYLIRMVGGDAIAPFYAMSVQELAAAVDTVARADGAQLVAGSVAGGHMTYVLRTSIMGFPDYISIRVWDAGGGASFSAFARARFGRSDLGVNRARMDRWIAALPDLTIAP
jgi:uncharacterized protein (DUF1499 family)